MKFRVLELFSGIGGMHTAFKYARLPGEIVRALDINTVANEVYSHNYPETPVVSRNIHQLKVQEVENINVNMILMSPPCQPHTRMGKKCDISDKRSDALNHLCLLLPQCPSIEFVLLENVMGFERSLARQAFVEALKKAGFFWREFILSPEKFGLPNFRPRYFCLARRNIDFPFDGGKLWFELPPEMIVTKTPSKQILLHDLLENTENIPTDAFVPDNMLLRHFWQMDIFLSDTKEPTDCFTKAYTHFAHGAGSVYSPLTDAESKPIFTALHDTKEDEPRLKLLRQLRLRYFTPLEVSRLMAFPDTFSFPESTTTRQKYRLLGNSINVVVVGELLKIIADDSSKTLPNTNFAIGAEQKLPL